MARKMYIGVTRPEYEAVFEKNAWSQIIRACQKNEVPTTWTVGSQKSMVINGTSYTIDIIGKNHDTYADGSGTAPLTFQLHDCYASSYAMNSSLTNSGGWTNCAMRKTHLPAILALMPSEVQAGIKEVSKKTSAGNKSSTINTTADKLFLLSEVEYFGTTKNSASGEGSRYAYYASGNPVKKNNHQWERSPVVANATHFGLIYNDNMDMNGAATPFGISFAFCFGGTSEVNNPFGGTNVARPVKKIYVGVDSKARRVKKGYIGIGGVARPFWGYGKTSYYGTITNLSVARFRLAATSNSNYALFGGGDNNSVSNVVDAYNKSLTRSTPTALSTARYQLGATFIGNYALFGGGCNGSSNRYTTVDAYNQSLTKSTPTALKTARYLLATTSNGNYALFAGGLLSGSGSNVVDAYNSSLTRSNPTVLSSGRFFSAATTVGNYMLVGGGDSSSGVSTVVDAYDKSLTRSTPTALSTARGYLAAATAGNYALFGGGLINNNSTQTDVVEAYNTSLTRSTPTKLSTTRSKFPAVTLGDSALFFGGHANGSGSTTVDAYDSSLTRSIFTSSNNDKIDSAATTVGNYALLGGGYSGSSTSVVEAFASV